MTKYDLIQLLIDDFFVMFPNATNDEKRHLVTRLQSLELQALKLLVDQIPPKIADSNKSR